jgi:hypothetical protein
MRIDMSARQRVVDQQQRVIRAEETRRQQEIDVRRQIEQRQEQVAENARLKTEACLKNIDGS